MVVVWAARLAVALLRDPLHLDRLRAFTSLDYATQIPTGDPAVAGRSGVDGGRRRSWLAVVIVVAVARAVGRQRGEAIGGAGCRGPSTSWPAWLAAAGACAIAVLTDLALGRVLADSSVSPFVLVSVRPWASGISMKIGLFSLTAPACCWAPRWLRRRSACFRRGLAGAVAARPGRSGAVLAGAMVGVLAVAAAAAGAGWTIVITGGLSPGRGPGPAAQSS